MRHVLITMCVGVFLLMIINTLTKPSSEGISDRWKSQVLSDDCDIGYAVTDPSSEEDRQRSLHNPSSFIR